MQTVEASKHMVAAVEDDITDIVIETDDDMPLCRDEDFGAIAPSVSFRLCICTVSALFIPPQRVRHLHHWISGILPRCLTPLAYTHKFDPGMSQLYLAHPELVWARFGQHDTRTGVEIRVFHNWHCILDLDSRLMSAYCSQTSLVINDFNDG